MSVRIHRVALNPIVGRTDEATAVANAVARRTFELLKADGRVKPIDVIALCQDRHPGHTGYFTANNKKRAIQDFDAKRGQDISFILNVRATTTNEIESSSLMHGRFVEFNLDKSAAMRLCASVDEAWAKSPLIIDGMQVKPATGSQSGSSIIEYSVSGNRSANGHGTVHHIPRLSTLKTLLFAYLDSKRDNGFITEAGCAKAKVAVGKAILAYKGVEVEGHLTELIRSAILDNIGLNVKGEMPQLKDLDLQLELARKLGLAAVLYTKRADDEFIPALTLVVGNMGNVYERAVLNYPAAQDTHALGVRNFLYGEFGIKLN